MSWKIYVLKTVKTLKHGFADKTAIFLLNVIPCGREAVRIMINWQNVIIEIKISSNFYVFSAEESSKSIQIRILGYNFKEWYFNIIAHNSEHDTNREFNVAVFVYLRIPGMLEKYTYTRRGSEMYLVYSSTQNSNQNYIIVYPRSLPAVDEV